MSNHNIFEDSIIPAREWAANTETEQAVEAVLGLPGSQIHFDSPWTFEERAVLTPDDVFEHDQRAKMLYGQDALAWRDGDTRYVSTGRLGSIFHGESWAEAFRALEVSRTFPSYRAILGGAA